VFGAGSAVASDGVEGLCSDGTGSGRYCGAPEPQVVGYSDGIQGVGPECSRIYYSTAQGDFSFRTRTSLDCTPDTPPSDSGFDEHRRMTVSGQTWEDGRIDVNGLFAASSGDFVAARVSLGSVAPPTANQVDQYYEYQAGVQVFVNPDGSRTVMTGANDLATLYEVTTETVTVTRGKKTTTETTTTTLVVGTYDLPLNFTTRTLP
jgi:hypothetical protein